MSLTNSATDNADSAMDASAAAGPPPPVAATFAVALKLPDFWLHDPPSWFVHVEAQFALRGISADDTKYHHVVASLDPLATRHAMTLLRDPPAQGKYAALKELLLRRYALSDAERAKKLLNLSGLGGGTALELMENMLSLLGPDDGGFLFAHLFLRQLPAAVSDPWSARQQRQLAAISEFTTDIQHVAGKSNHVADCLSRVLVSPVYVGIDYAAMAAEQRADPDILALQSTKTGLVLEDTPVWDGGPHLLCDVSTGRPRPVVPLSWRRRVFDSVHALSHPGVRASVKLVSARHDAHRTPLRPPYDGPYRVLKPGNKHFILDFGGRQEVVSVDRLKPAHVLHEDQVAPAQAPRPGRPPATGLMDSVFSPRSDPQSTESESSAAFSDRQCQPRFRAGLPSVSSPPPRFSRSGRLLKPRVLD
ncbi:unnamed protein product [Oreochromis niloticus]|nr:unnamed protein product [Mustela putorius furo]